MKRALFGVIWFFALTLFGLIGAGAVVGFTAGNKIQAVSFADGYAKGRTAGEEFGRNYAGVIVLGALALSIAGTVARVLPGTRRRSDFADEMA
jgi:hypothetical protein